MITYAEALSRVLETAGSKHPPLIEEVPLLTSVGRVCSRSYTSPAIVPPFDNSAMDGFAVHSEWTQKASEAEPVRFKFLGSIAAGDWPLKEPPQDGAWEIMTGAPLPEGFDAVVKVEDVILIRDADGNATEIELTRSVKPRENRRLAGEDFQIGTPLIERGSIVSPEHILSMASLGISHLELFQPPRVALISTGRELVSHEACLGDGQIRNSTAPYLMTLMNQLGASVEFLGTIADEAEEFGQLMRRRVLRSQVKAFDLVLTTGAVSMGKFDFVTEQLKYLGADIHFHKITIRPGKPLVFAEFKNGPAFFGLPGNPVSSAVGFRFFVEPYLRAIQHRKIETPIYAQVISATKKPPGLRCFYKAYLQLGQDGAQVSLSSEQQSFKVRPLLQSNVWAVIPEAEGEVKVGELIETYPLSSIQNFELGNQKVDRSNQNEARGGCCS